MKIVIIPNDRHAPAGKVADAELHFEAGEPLAGLKLIGFSIWERRQKGTGFNVTFPSKSYSVNGERRSFSQLRPADADATRANDTIRDLILTAYAAHEAGR